VKTRENEQRQEYDQRQSVQKKGTSHQKVYSSHITNLPGAHNALDFTDTEIEWQ